MGRQEGLIQLSGRVGNVSFFKTKNGDYLARKSRGIDGDRIKTERRYRRTRENMAEFGRAVVASKLLRKALRTTVLFIADKGVSNRMTSALMRVIKADTVSPRGERNAVDGNPVLLEGFQFNQHAEVGKTLLVQITSSIDRATGTMVVDIPEYVPDNVVEVPEGATHFRFRIGGGTVDFATNTYSVVTAESADIPSFTTEVQAPMQLSVTVPSPGTLPLFLVFGIEFQQLANDVLLPLSNGSFNAMAIVKVDAGGGAS